MENNSPNRTAASLCARAVSLEGREPLLDHRIIEFVATLPSTHKFHQGVQKRVLKDVVHRYLPQETMNRPKMGFGVPIHAWFRSQLRELMMTHLDEKKLARDGIFDSVQAVEIRDRYLGGSDADMDRCWYLLTFEMWKERWL